VPLPEAVSLDRMDRTDWDTRYRERTTLRDPNRFVVSTLKGSTPGTALDLACGAGRNAVWLAEQGWSVTGVDWSAEALERAAGTASEHGVEVRWVQADLADWEPDGEYDLVVIVYLQIPEAERHRVWRRAAGAVALGGRLLVIGHDARNLEEGHAGPSHPSVLYTATEVAGVVGDALVVERSGTVVRPVEADGVTHHAIDNLVLARRPGGAPEEGAPACPLLPSSP